MLGRRTSRSAVAGGRQITSKSQSTGGFQYNPSLDGIRAIAVTSVAVYHGFLGWGTGGFLGVDLFFVLSGYLITTLLLLENSSTGGVSLRAFWLRRAKRLLPALFFVLVWVAWYARFVADPAALDGLRRDGLATILYIANWNFIVSGESYFEQFVSPSPLRHMWSLAIEEQWYLVWPVVVAAALRWKPFSRTPWVSASLLAAAGSAVLMAVLAAGQIDTSRAYYGTDSRAQALLIGCCLAFVLTRSPSELFRRSAPALGFFGVAGFLAFVFLVEDTDRWMYRGGFLVVAVVGAALVASATIDTPGNLVRRALAVPPLPLIGRMSYGLYLWHWPIYVYLTADRTGLDGPALFGLRVAVTVAVSTASYVLIEQPVRKSQLGWNRLGPAALVAAGVVATLLVMGTTDVTETFDRSDSVAADGATPSATPPDVFVVGDSVYVLLLSSLEDQSFEGMNVRSGAVLGCGVLPPVGNVPDECRDRFSLWAERLDAYQPDEVVVGFSTWDIVDRDVDGQPIDFGGDEFRAYATAEIDDVLSAVNPQRASPVHLVNLPCKNAAEINERNNRLGGMSQQELERRTLWFNTFIQDYAEGQTEHGVQVLDAAGYLCPEGAYQPEVDSVNIYMDGMHFTEPGGTLFWDWLRTELDVGETDERPTSEPVDLAPSDPAVDPTGGLRRIYVVGDSRYVKLVLDLDRSRHPGAEIISGTIVGCGLLPPPEQHNPPACRERYTRWSRDIAQHEPDLVVAALSLNDLLDRDVEGQATAYGSETLRGAAIAELDRLMAVFDPDQTTQIRLLTFSCADPVDTLTPHSAMSSADRAERAAWLNNLVREYASAMTEHSVSVVEAATFGCQDSLPIAEVAGTPLYEDGYHYTEGGADLFWEWLLPQL